MADMSSIPRRERYEVLILDNEVTVGHFVANPPLSWNRLTLLGESYGIADGYPTFLTEKRAREEMRMWDRVSVPAMTRTLKSDLDSSVDYVVFGNNAGQGLSLALQLPEELRASKSAIIYGTSFPEKEIYEQGGYRTFLPRKNLIPHLRSLAATAERTLTLAFINTIQHDATNFHNP